MPAVIQIFNKTAWTSKGAYTPENRNKFFEWPEKIESRAGFLNEKTLFLEREKSSASLLRKKDLIIIQDILWFDRHYEKKKIEALPFTGWFKDQMLRNFENENVQFKSFGFHSGRWEFEIFELKPIPDGGFEIWLSNALAFEYTYPNRESHKLGELKKGKPIRILLNWKNDSTGYRRNQRSFLECDYIMEITGEAEEFEFKDLNYLNVEKTIPFDKCKIIDERKDLF